MTRLWRELVETPFGTHRYDYAETNDYGNEVEALAAFNTSSRKPGQTDLVKLSNGKVIRSSGEVPDKTLGETS